MPRANLTHGMLGPSEDLTHRSREDFKGRSGRLLNEDITIGPVLERIHHQLDRFLQRHHEARHRRIGNRHGPADIDLLDEERNH